MGAIAYHSGCAFARFVFAVSMRVGVVNRAGANAIEEGGYVLAVTHFGHVEPGLCSLLSRRRIDWIAREEYFRYWWSAPLLQAMDSLSMRRFACPVGAIREAIRRVRAGRVVGIFPEGEVCRGGEAMVRGGVCSIAIRGGVPVVPCVVLGTEKLNTWKPWLPLKAGRIYVAYGEAIQPAAVKSTRRTREALAGELSRAFQRLYGQLRHEFNIDDAAVP